MSHSSGSTPQRDHPRQRGYTAGKAIPDRWLDYSNCGYPIVGTRFFAFKTPLKNDTLNRIDENRRWSIDDLINQVPNLGLVIDLTYTKKYYDFEIFESKGIQYHKIFCQGHHIPAPEVCQEFHNIVNNFFDRTENNGKLVGVHCTHGLNRTGYLVCHYLINALRWHPQKAVEEFERARGHRMERENYIKSLFGRRR